MHGSGEMSKLSLLRTGVVAAGAARGVVSPVFGQGQVALEQAEEPAAAQPAQKPRKVPDPFWQTILHFSRVRAAPHRLRCCALRLSRRQACSGNFTALQAAYK